MSDPVAVVRAYFDAVTAGDPKAVGALFAPDAELHNAAGVLRGAAAITKMYEGGLGPGKMKPSPGPFVIDGERVAVEIDLMADGKPLALGDFFTIRDGKIHYLAIYSLKPVDPAFFREG
ncbi:nuclear transport factor 2 family protein [Nocardia vinacea]|uniref:nuclear transport factor 2 family protein n=1 Tax=Nocardia vinacea TaxID=96468 RepID=UPI002E10B93C|nr:nuclear transport factor 2 family protein [Nocardia vinacea]